MKRLPPVSRWPPDAPTTPEVSALRHKVLFMTHDLQGVSEHVDRAGERYIHLLRELVRVSQGGERAIQEWVAAELKALGCNVDLFRYSPKALAPKYEFAEAAAVDPGERLCVVGRLTGEQRGRRLLLFAHPDAEPVSSTDGWRHAPFAGEVEGGRLYGWGVADDLLGVATMIGGLMVVATSGRRPRGTVLLASTPSKRNVRGIVAVLERGYAADGAVYLHPAESGRGLRDIKAITSGLLRFRISVAGKPPDTQEPEQTPFHHLAVNPIDKAWVLVRALQSLNETRAGRVRHAFLEDAVGRSTNMQVAYLHAGEPDQLSRISRTCVLAGSVTFPPHEHMESVQSEIARSIEAAAQADPWLRDHPPQLEWLLGTRGAEVPLEHPLCLAVRRAIRAVTACEPTVNALHASSDIRHPILHGGIPAVGYGPLAGNFSQAGGTDEWVDLGEYLQAITVTGRLILEWCGGEEIGPDPAPAT